MQEIVKNTHGGRREGAGRPKTTFKSIGFRAPKDVAEILEGKDNMSLFICDAIRAYKG